jgi:hypothetical protein
LTKTASSREKRVLNQERAAERYIEEYKGRINYRLMTEGKAKTRLKLQVFDKSIIEEKKRKYGHS